MTALWVVMTVLVPLGTYAQNNPYKIRDDLHSLYLKAYQNRTKKEGLRLADSLYTCAKTLSDGKAACLARVVRMSYAFHNAATIKDFDIECNRLKEVSQQTGFLQYYFFALSERGSFLLNKRQFLLAIRNANSVYSDAKRMDNDYGIFTYYNCMSRIHYLQGDYVAALDYLDKAYAFCKQKLPEQDLGSICTMFANIYFRQYEFDKALSWVEDGLEEVRNDNMKFTLLQMKMKCLFYQGKYNDFKNVYDYCENWIKKNERLTNVRLLMLYRLVIDKKFDEANALAESSTDNAEKLTMMCSIYYHTGKRKEAFELSKRLFAIHFEVSVGMSQPYAMSEVESAVGKYLLDEERLDLEYDNANALLQSTLNEERLAFTEASLARMHWTNDSLQTIGLKADSTRAAYEKETGEFKAAAAKLRAEQRTLLMLSGAVAAFMLICCGGFVFLQKCRRLKDLSNKNILLKIALDKANEANRMRDAFIEHLSYEVRTPLNDIVGFADVAIRDGDSLSDEDKRIISDNIAQSSDKLTNLVNDVLKKSLEESVGKSTVVLLFLILSGISHPCLISAREKHQGEFEKKISEYIDKKLSLTAVSLTQKELSDATKCNDVNRMYHANIAMAMVYESRFNNKRAVECLEAAMEIHRKYRLKDNPFSLQMELAKHNRRFSCYDRAEEYLREAICQGSDRQSLFDIEVERAFLKYCTNDTAGFFNAFDNIRQLGKTAGISASDRGIIEAQYMIFQAPRGTEGDEVRKKAFAHAAKDNGLLAINRLRTVTEVNAENWDNALKRFQREASSYIWQRSNVFRNDRWEMDMLNGNKQLEDGNKRLRLDNARLELQNHKDMVKLQQNVTDSLRLVINRNQIERNRLTSKTRYEKAQADNARTQAERELEREQLATIALFVLLGLAVLVIVLVSVFIVFQRRDARILAAKNDELDNALAKAQESDRMKKEFIKSMSHEIRTPLNAIVGFSQLLLCDGGSLADEERNVFISTINSNEILLRQLLEDIITVHDIENQPETGKISPVSPVEICRRAIAAVTPNQGDSMKVCLDTDMDVDFRINSSGCRIEQVLVKFLSNAIKFSGGGKVTIGCNLTEHPGKVTFFVADTGPGIPADKREEIFERFVKLDTFRQGTGLGLHICRKIAEILQADIMVDPEYTSGARMLLIVDE